MPGALFDEPARPSVGLVVALHGFTRSPEHLDELARGCTRSGLACLRPLLAPSLDPMRIGRPRAIERIADLLADSICGFDGPVVLLGHSAGAAAACWIARTWRKAGTARTLAGLVLVDGVDGVTRLLDRSIDDLDGVPMVALTAEPGRCNRQGALAGFLDCKRPGVTLRILGAAHGDIEGEDRWVYRLGCKERSSDRMRTLVIANAVQACLRLSSLSVSGSRLADQPVS